MNHNPNVFLRKLSRCGSSWLVSAAAGSLLLGLSGMAQAQVAQVFWNCRPASAGVEAGWCPVGSSNPLPISGTFSASLAVAPLTSTNLSSSIATTNTFQSVQTLASGRKGCLIQNQSSSNSMWVFFGPIGSATKASSFQLDSAHGESVSCAVGGLGVVTDQVSITGTGADTYVASFQ